MEGKSSVDVVHARYGTMAVFVNDTGAATKSLLKYGEWAENEISFLHHFVEKGSTVVDVGAYIGTHTLAFASFVGAQGRVIAIEAQPATFGLLQRNIAMATPGVIQAKHALASHQLEWKAIPTIDVKQQASFGSASLLATLATGAPASQGVFGTQGEEAHLPSITIDSLDLEKCALIKADVEGVEDLVLRGALQTLQRCSPVVYCECNALATGLRVVETLRLAGYKVVAHVVNAFNPDNFFHVNENIFGEAREIGLLGIPEAQFDSFVRLPVRPVELALQIDEADDLALALLNKPQYQCEVLRSSAAAKTGGDQFLNHYDSLRLGCDRVADENAASDRLVDNDRVDEKHSDVREGGNLAWVQNRLAELNMFLDQRDAAIADIQAELLNRGLELQHMHELLTQRDLDIKRLQMQLADKSGAISELHARITERDAAILLLQKELRA